MMRNNTPSKLVLTEKPQTSKQIIILPPSPKTVDENNRSFNIPIVQDNNIPTHNIQHANAMFDPNNASPASEFMSLLKLRMSVYFEQEINMFN